MKGLEEGVCTSTMFVPFEKAAIRYHLGSRAQALIRHHPLILGFLTSRTTGNEFHFFTSYPVCSTLL
jgi:hypothetical protein